MAHWAFEQGHHIPPFLAFFNQAKYRIQCIKVSINDFRRMLDTHIDTIASQITLGKHFLGNEGFIGQCIRALNGKTRQCRQTPMVNFQAMLVGQLQRKT